MKIVAPAGELRQGLFGQVVLWVFEILPWLREQGIERPSWEICSELYGLPPRFSVIPGVFEPAREPASPRQEAAIPLSELRRDKCSVLGGDFSYANDLWNSYFKIPQRILAEADRFELPSNTLGFHYRGTDKNQAAWDTNPVSYGDFLSLAQDFIRRHPSIKAIFIATDEAEFLREAKARLEGVAIFHVGLGEFHKGSDCSSLKADNALLDCILLSRCRFVLQCSSALSAFAKVLNPSLEIYRVAASKLFADIPYFPVAYIPRLESEDPLCQEILQRHMIDDWRDVPGALEKFGKPFGARPRGPLS